MLTAEVLNHFFPEVHVKFVEVVTPENEFGSEELNQNDHDDSHLHDHEGNNFIQVLSPTYQYLHIHVSYGYEFDIYYAVHEFQ